MLEMGPFATRTADPHTEDEGNVMSTLIRVVKRGSEDKKDENESVPSAKSRVTTEMTVKRWIIESREHRRNVMTQLQSSIDWEQLGGLARG